MIQAVSNYFKGAALGGEIEFEFEADQVSLEIPHTGIVEAGWTIQIVTPPVVRWIIIMSFVVMLQTMEPYTMLLKSQ